VNLKPEPVFHCRVQLKVNKGSQPDASGGELQARCYKTSGKGVTKIKSWNLIREREQSKVLFFMAIRNTTLIASEGKRKVKLSMCEIRHHEITVYISM
jgi:hypothetical protein